MSNVQKVVEKIIWRWRNFLVTSGLLNIESRTQLWEKARDMIAQRSFLNSSPLKSSHKRCTLKVFTSFVNPTVLPQNHSWNTLSGGWSNNSTLGPLLSSVSKLNFIWEKTQSKTALSLTIHHRNHRKFRTTEANPLRLEVMLVFLLRWWKRFKNHLTFHYTDWLIFRGFPKISWYRKTCLADNCFIPKVFPGKP